MKNFNDLELNKHLFHQDGGYFDKQALMFFKNGFGVSVVTGKTAHGNYEIAVLKGNAKDFDLCFTTSITNDVIACTTKKDVSKTMKKVQKLTKT